MIQKDDVSDDNDMIDSFSDTSSDKMMYLEQWENSNTETLLK